MPDDTQEAAVVNPKREKAQALVDAWRNQHFNNPASAVGDSYFAAEKHLVDAIAGEIA